MNECGSTSEDQCALDNEQVKWLIENEKQTSKERALFVHWPACGSTCFERFKCTKNWLHIHQNQKQNV